MAKGGGSAKTSSPGVYYIMFKLSLSFAQSTFHNNQPSTTTNLPLQSNQDPINHSALLPPCQPTSSKMSLSNQTQQPQNQMAGLPLCPPPDIDDTPLWLQPDIPLSPSPNNYYTHLLPTLSATPIKYEGYLGTHLVPPHLTLRHFPRDWMRTKNSSSILGKAMSNQECLCQRKRESGSWRKRSKKCRT